MMSEDSRPSTSTASPILCPHDEVSTDVITTSSASQNREQLVPANNNSSCCNANTRRFASLAYGAFVLVACVVFLVAAKVDTDKKGIHISSNPVYRCLAILLFVAILWMATFIFSKCFSEDFRGKYLSSHIEPEKQLIPTRLLVGVMFFGLGSSFMTMVELLEYSAEYDCPSKDLSMLFYYIVRTIFIYIQLYFFYKLSRPTKKVLILSHFLIMHLIAVNLGTWFVTFVYDSAEELNEDSHDGTHHNNSTMSNSTVLFMARHWGVIIDSPKNLTESCINKSEALKSTAKKMEPYLYTFTMEYCLISAALLLNAWLSLRSSDAQEQSGGQNGIKKRRNGDHEGNKSQSGRSQNGNLKGHNKQDGGNKGGHKGQRRDPKGQHGNNKYTDIDTDIESDESYEIIEKPDNVQEMSTLWRFGFILGLAYIPAFMAIVINLMYTDDEENDQLVYIGMQFFFFASIFIASLIGNAQIQKQQEREKHQEREKQQEREKHQEREKQQEGEKENQVDFNLLGVSLVGVFFLDLLIIIASICEMAISPSIAWFLIITNITEICCSVTFTLFVRKALEHKLPAETNDTVLVSAASKIREVVSFLFMLNICFWGMYTFEVKKSNKVLAIVERFYTKDVWFYLSHFVYPLAVFFHFHGAVCMVEILSHYSISKPRKILTSASMTMSHAAVQT